MRDAAALVREGPQRADPQWLPAMSIVRRMHDVGIEHRDLNLAVIFSVWDFIFRTQWLDFDDYPDTGIHDEQFPIEKSGRPLDLLVSTLSQFLYPFKSAFGKAT